MPDSKTISVAPAGSTKVNDIVASFGDISFSKDHLAAIDASNPTRAKTYTYTVKEVAPTTGAIDKLRYSKAEYQVAVTVKAVLDEKTGKYSGLTTSTTVTQVKDDMGNTVNKVIGTADAPANAIPASTFTNVKVLTDLPRGLDRKLHAPRGRRSHASERHRCGSVLVCYKAPPGRPVRWR